MGDKIIQKNILKVVSERLNPNNNVSEMKQKNCLVCKKKKTLNSPVKKRHTEQPI